MVLKTRAILTVNITTATMDDERRKKMKANEDVLNEVLVVSNCFNCEHADWNRDHTAVKCTRHNMTPPLWCVACGCQDFDYMPF